MVGVVSVVALVIGDGSNSLIDLLIEGSHYRGGAETRCMERIGSKRHLPFIRLMNVLLPLDRLLLIDRPFVLFRPEDEGTL